MAEGTLATEYICTLINSGLRRSGCYEVVTVVEVRGWLYTQDTCQVPYVYLAYELWLDFLLGGR